MNARRRGFTLLLVLASLTVAAALITPLALLTGSEALHRSSAAWALKHKLASDSVIQLLPNVLSERVRNELRDGRGKRLQLTIGDVEVEALLQDDSAKLPLERLAQYGAEAVGPLAATFGLAAVRVVDRAASTQCFEDVLAEISERDLFGSLDDPGWIAAATPIAGPVNVRTASPAVLTALLSDLDRELGRKLAIRRQRGWNSLEELLVDLELPEQSRRTALQRLSETSVRFSLLIRTRIENDIRTRYVIVHAESPPLVVVDWEVSP